MSASADSPVPTARVLQTPPHTALLALAPLLIIVLGLVTPPIMPHALYQYSPRIHPLSPLEDDLSWIWLIHVVAFALAALTLVHARRKSEPGLGARIAIAAGTLGVLYLPVVMLIVVKGEAWALTATSAAVIVATVAALVQAVRRPGWTGWLWLLAAYAIAALPYACPLFPGIFNEFCGGLTFVIADIALLALIWRALRRR